MVALYIQYRDGVPDEDRRRLYQHARLSMADQDAVNSLVHLGVRISRVSIGNCNLSRHLWLHLGTFRQGHQEEAQAEDVQ